MRNKYTPVGTTRFWHKLALAGLLAAGTTAAQAQFYSAPNVLNTTGTYTDLGTAGTAIATANTDDANSAATPIGFTFTYNGTAFTDFVLNTNGFLKLGTTAPTGPSYTDGGQSIVNGPIAGADANLLLPFNQDLFAGTAGGTEYRVATTGTAPNRVCTIQWKNVSDKVRTTFGTQYANISFQAKLYETSNQVDFVYGPATAGPAAGDVAKFVTVGIKGTDAAQSVLGVKASATVWSGTTFISGNYTGNAHNVRTTALPDPGRTYTFIQTAANDAGVQAVYSLGKLPIPIATPHIIQAVVRNTGSGALTNVSVTASIAGANAFTSMKTIASLAVGASTTVDFDPYTPTTAATQTITVTLANDGNNTNNTKTYQQQVNTSTFAYAEPGVAASSSIGFNTGSGILATKYTTNAARLATAVNVFLNDVNAVGKTVYGVVTDANGTLIGTSPNYVVVAADIATYHTFTFSAPASVPAGEFYVGLAQTVGTGGYFPVGNQQEDPSRANSTFSIPLAGGTPADQVAGNLGRLMIEAVTGAVPANDAAVQNIYSLGKAPLNTAQTIQAVIRNNGSAAFTNLAVALNVTGANTYATAQVVPTLAAGASTTISFPAFTPTAVGNNTIMVTVPTDGVASNNTQTYTQVVTASTFGYANGIAPTSGVGFSPNATTGVYTTGAFISKFTTTAARTISAVGAGLTDTRAIGRTVYAVVVNAAGGLVSRSADYVIQAADIDQIKSFSFSTAVPVAAGDFYVGLVQVAAPTGTPAFFPLATQNESPTRPATFYVIVPFTVTGGTLVDAAPNNLGAFVLEAQNATVQGTSAALKRAVAMYPNPSTGVVQLDVRGANAKGNLSVQVINLLGQTVYTSSLKDNFTNEVNLSGLANGIYTLKVQTGSEFTSRQLVLTK